MTTEYVEIYYDECIVETEDAVLLETAEGNKWIPKSCIRDEKDIHYPSYLFVEVERWFAEKEELI